MTRLIAILIFINIFGIIWSQDIPYEDSIVKNLIRKTGSDIDSVDIRIGGGRIKALVILDTCSYISDTINIIQGVNYKWIKTITVSKNELEINFGGEHVFYHVALTVKKRFQKKVLEYIVKNNIETVPNRQ